MRWAAVLGSGLLVGCGSSDKGVEKAGADDSGPGADGSEGSDGSDGSEGSDGSDGSDGNDETGATLSGELRLPDGAAALPTLRVSLVHASFDGSGPPELGLGLDTVTAASERFTLELPPRPPDSLVVELAREWPEARGSIYLPIAYEAEDGDPEATFRDGHLVRGAGLDQLVVWLDPAATALPEGWRTGWSVVDTGMAGMHEPNRCLFNTSEPLLWREHAGYPHFSPVDEGLELLLRGLPTTLELAGDSSLRAEGTDRIAGVPFQVATGGATDLEPVFDVAVGDTFSAVLDTPPPDDHDTTSDPDWRYTQAIALLYADADASGDWSLDADGPTTTGYTQCVDDEPVLIRFTREPRSWKGYRFLDCYGGTAGWRGIVFDVDIGNYAYVEPADMLRLQTGPRCVY